MAWIEFFSTLDSGYSYPLIPVYFFYSAMKKQWLSLLFFQ